jgi:hypothetical protein
MLDFLDSENLSDLAKTIMCWSMAAAILLVGGGISIGAFLKWRSDREWKRNERKRWEDLDDKHN